MRVLDALTEFCPAKINPYLAVTGKRGDGFHDLVSIVAPINVGDTLEVKARLAGFRLTCDDPELPTDCDNLVMRAATVFCEMSGWTGGAEFHLRKRIPSGAGLGGGSSDAVGALRALNTLSGGLLDAEALHAAAAAVGSDCPLFLSAGPVVIRGRGERVEADAPIAAKLRNRELLVLKPGFGVNTAWAYREMASQAPAAYLPAGAVAADISRWREAKLDPTDLGFNSFTAVVGRKFPAIPAMVQRLQAEFGVALHLSGSGSACFVWLDAGIDGAAVEQQVRDGWGAEIWTARARCC